MKRIVAAAVVFLTAFPAFADGPIPIVAAENFYGEVAKAVGGDHVGRRAS